MTQNGTLNPTLNILIGAPGSGKSTITEQISSSWAHKHFTIICPDEIREEFCGGNRADQSKNGLVWKAAYDRVLENMKIEHDIIFDSTMMSPKKRKQLIKMGQEYGYFIIAHVVERDKEVIYSQNLSRKWAVPEFVIDNMLKSYIRPTLEEGFDYIIDY